MFAVSDINTIYETICVVVTVFAFTPNELGVLYLNFILLYFRFRFNRLGHSPSKPNSTPSLPNPHWFSGQDRSYINNSTEHVQFCWHTNLYTIVTIWKHNRKPLNKIRLLIK